MLSLFCVIHDNEVDILCICETWLDSFLDDKYIKIRNYNVIRCDAGRGGGTCIYVRDDLKITPINVNIDKGNIEGIEDIYIQIQSKKFPSLILGCIYRHPKALASSFSYLADVFKALCLRNKPIFIVGDLNDNLFNMGSNLNKIVNNLNLKQIIDKPTRIAHNSSTLLDVAITNNVDMIVYSNVLPSTIADHEMLSFIVNIRKPKYKPETRTFRSRKNYSQDIFCGLLLDEVPLLNRILDTDNVNTQVDILTKSFIKCLDQCAPLVTSEINQPFAPWIDQDLRNIIK